jgi:putative flippase GtrA
MTIPPQNPTVMTRALGLARNRAVRGKAVRFGLVGIVNTAVDYGIFALCYLHFGLHPIAANVVSWMIAGSGSYILNSTITFAAESGRVLRLRDYLRFLASNVIGLAANTATVVIASYFMPVLAGKAIAIGVSFVVNFSLAHYVVFPAERSGPPA